MRSDRRWLRRKPQLKKTLLRMSLFRKDLFRKDLFRKGLLLVFYNFGINIFTDAFYC